MRARVKATRKGVRHEDDDGDGRFGPLEAPVADSLPGKTPVVIKR